MLCDLNKRWTLQNKLLYILKRNYANRSKLSNVQFFFFKEYSQVNTYTRR